MTGDDLYRDRALAVVVAQSVSLLSTYSQIFSAQLQRVKYSKRFPSVAELKQKKAQVR